METALADVPGVEVTFLDRATREEVSGYLRDHASSDFHVLHYMGHGAFDAGTGEGGLRLTGEEGYTPGSALAQILREAPSLRLAVLNGCHTARSSSDRKSHPFAAWLRPCSWPVCRRWWPCSAESRTSRHRLQRRLLFRSDRGRAGRGRGKRWPSGDSLSGPQASEWAMPALFLEGSGRLFPRGSDPMRAYLQSDGGAIGKTGSARNSTAGPSILRPPGFGHRSSPLPPLDPFTLTQAPPSPPLGIEESPGILAPFGHDPRIVLLGGAGSGKTTLLHWIALRHAAAKLGKETHLRLTARQVDPSIRDGAGDEDDEIDAGPTRVPILVRLADYNAARRQVPSLSLTAFLGHHLAPGQTKLQGHRGAPLNLEFLHRHLLRSLNDGTALVLLDGLDEIAESRRTVRQRPRDRPLPGRVAPGRIRPQRRAAGRRRQPGRGLRRRTPRPRRLSLAPGAARSNRHPPAVCRLEKRTRGRREACDHARSPSPSPDGENPASNPRLATLWTVLQQYEPAAGLRRRVELYETAVALELDDWRRRCGLEGVRHETLLATLAEWIAESGALAENGDLAAKLKRVLPEAQAELAADALSAQDSGGGLLHPAFREYLAACWLASDPEFGPREAPGAAGRAPLARAFAHGPRADERGSESRRAEKALLLLLDAEDPLGGLLPRAAALLAAAIPEMIQIPARVVEEAASRLIQAWADLSRSGAPPGLLHFGAYLRAAGGRHTHRRAGSRLMPGPRGGIPRPVSRRGPPVAPLPPRHGRDRRGSHVGARAERRRVGMAGGRRLARYRPPQTRSPPLPARDAPLGATAPARPAPTLPERSRLATGRPRPVRRFRPEGVYRDSAVTPCLLSVLEASLGETLASRLRRLSTDPAEETRRDALLALMALGEPVAAELRQADPAARRARAHLSRVSRALETSVPAAIGPALASLERNAGLLFRDGQGCDRVAALIDVTLAFGGATATGPRPGQGRSRGGAPPAAGRGLALSGGRSPRRPGLQPGRPPRHRGETLASPPLRLAETLALAPASANARWTAIGLEPRSPRPAPRAREREVLSSALDSRRPRRDLRLRPELGPDRPGAAPAGGGLDTRSPDLRRESLSDRFNAREEAVRALTIGCGRRWASGGRSRPGSPRHGPGDRRSLPPAPSSPAPGENATGPPR